MPLVFDFAEDNTVLCRDPKTTLIGPGVEDTELETYLL
jgi:hypothetical protein